MQVKRFASTSNLDQLRFSAAVRKFLEFAHRLGARLSFRKIPDPPPAAPGPEGNGVSGLASFLRNVLRRWEERDARRLVVIAKGVTLRRLLREVSYQLLGSCIAAYQGFVN